MLKLNVLEFCIVLFILSLGLFRIFLNLSGDFEPPHSYKTVLTEKCMLPFHLHSSPSTITRTKDLLQQ